MGAESALDFLSILEPSDLDRSSSFKGHRELDGLSGLSLKWCQLLFQRGRRLLRGSHLRRLRLERWLIFGLFKKWNRYKATEMLSNETELVQHATNPDNMKSNNTLARSWRNLVFGPLNSQGGRIVEMQLVRVGRRFPILAMFTVGLIDNVMLNRQRHAKRQDT